MKTTPQIMKRRNMRSGTTSVFFLLLALTLSVGCSENVQVRGKVAWDNGSPLTEGNIVFENSKMSAVSTINSDGTFSMGLVKPGEGMPPGEYKVTVVGGDMFLRAPSGKLLIDPQFCSYDKTPLTATIVKGQNPPLEFVVHKNKLLQKKDEIAPPPVNSLL